MSYAAVAFGDTATLDCGLATGTSDGVSRTSVISACWMGVVT